MVAIYVLICCQATAKQAENGSLQCVCVNGPVIDPQVACARSNDLFENLFLVVGAILLKWYVKKKSWKINLKFINYPMNEVFIHKLSKEASLKHAHACALLK